MTAVPEGSHVPAEGRRSDSNRWREVLDVCAKLFFERGYESTSVNDISAALRITKGALYHYVDSKEDLLQAIIEDIHGLTQQRLIRERAEEGDPLERLWSYFVGHVRLNTDNLYASTLIYRDLQHLSPERRTDTVKIRDELQGYVRELLAEARDLGLIAPDLDLELASILMFSVANGIYQWYQAEGPASPQDVAQSVATFVVRSVASPSWSPPLPA